MFTFISSESQNFVINLEIPLAFLIGGLKQAQTTLVYFVIEDLSKFY